MEREISQTAGAWKVEKSFKMKNDALEECYEEMVKKYYNSPKHTIFIDSISDSIDSEYESDEAVKITPKQIQDSWDAVKAASAAWSMTKK